MRRRYTLFCIGILFCTMGLHAQNFQLNSSDLTNTEFEFHLGDFERNSQMISGMEYHNFAMDHSVLMSELGAPAMPFFSEAIQISLQGNVSYEIMYDDVTIVEDINIVPSKGNLKRNVDPATIPYTFGEVYNQNEFYPGELSKMSEPFILRNTRGVTISLFPYQYNPIQKKLLIYNNLRVLVHVDGSINGINELEPAQEKSQIYQNIYQNVYLNPDENPNYEPIGENGSMLIITAPEYVENIQALADWKIQSGIRTNIVTTDETGTTATQIKAFLQDYYDTMNDFTFLLLVGDSNEIPAHTYGNNGEQLWSDSFYGQLAGGNNDLFPEVLVGRLSGNAQEIDTMVDRILEYEKIPMDGNWMKNAIGLGSNEGNGYGDDGEADYVHLRNIRTQLMAFGYENIYEFYQGSQGGEDAPGEPTATMINEAMNTGTSLFNYTGHGWLEGMYTGYYTNSDVLNLQNQGKYPFVISVACNNGTFVNGTTLGEVFLRAQQDGSPTGAIAFAGSSILMAWAEPMETQDEMTNLISEYYDSQRNATLGGLFYNAQIGMLTDYGISPTAKEVMQTWVLFGDPSVQYRNQITQEITANHAESVSETDISFSVDSNAEDAMATLSQNGVIIGKAWVSGGVAEIIFEEEIDFDPSVGDPILTITKQNYKPYQSTIFRSVMGIADLENGMISIYPNPANDFVNISWDKSHLLQKIEVLDISGRIISRMDKVQNNGNQQINISSLSTGTYVVHLFFENKVISKKLIVK